MAEKKVVKASDYLKNSPKKKTTSTSTKSKLDLGKLKNIIDDNPEAVRKIKEGVTEIITKKVVSKKLSGSSKKTTTKKSSSSDSLSKMMDLAGTFLKK